MKSIFTKQQVQEYHDKGYVVAQNLFPKEAATEWKAIIKERLINEGHIDEPSGVRVWWPEAMDAYTEQQLQTPEMVAALQQLIGPDVEFLSVKVVFKNAKTTFHSPWHQDWFYWQGTPKISAWIALDDATEENGCLRLVPGSHRNVFEKQDIDDGKGFNYRIAEELVDDLSVETAPVKQGDAIFFHDLVLHGSCPNIAGTGRWCTIATYRDASQKDSSTVWDAPMVLSGESVNLK